jgi:uncharacterized protein DUF3551
MKLTSKTLAASAATVSTLAFFVMTAPAAYADDYCITNGAQAAHGCGYPSMETCKAAAAGIGGTCSASASSKSPSSDALNYQPKQPSAKAAPRRRNEPAGN